MGFVRYFRDEKELGYHVKRCVGQSHASRKHAHSELVISLVTGGSSLFRFGEDEHHIENGQMVMIGPGFVHQCCPSDVDAWSFTMVLIREEWLKTNGISEVGRPCFVVKDLDSRAYATLKQHFDSLCRGLENREESLLYIVGSALSDPEDAVLSLGGAGLESDAIRRVCDYIRDNLTETLPLDSLAALADMNKYTLIRCFGNLYNTTPHAWQNMLRMEEAKRMLESGCTITDTAVAMGFYDQSHFSRVFKESHGVTPKQFVQGCMSGM